MTDYVTDEEKLYRRILFGKKHYRLNPETKTYEVTSQAFSDRALKPSVDRAKLCGFNPPYTQTENKNSVVSFLALEMRSIDTVTRCYAIEQGLIAWAVSLTTKGEKW